MNDSQRAAIAAIATSIENVDDIDEAYGAFVSDVEDAWDRFMEAVASIKKQASLMLTPLEEVKQIEQEAFNNLPESLRDSEAGAAQQEAINSLDNAYEALQEFIDAEPSMPELSMDFENLEAVLEGLNDAVGVE